MRLVAAALLALGLLFPEGVKAQAADTPASKPEAKTVHAAFVKLVDRGEARALFGLPGDTFWRRNGGLRMALLGENADDDSVSLKQIAAAFSRATGETIAVVDQGPAPLPGQNLGTVAEAADLVIIVGPRIKLAEIALVEGFNKGMLARFELGTWPFMFSFADGPGRRGTILLADDEPPRAREASFILATVWALGAVTLGPELTGLISDDEVKGPGLTPLGEAVFALFYNDELEIGMTIENAILRAKTLLAE